MFLIKLAFWLALLVLILPTDPAKQEKLAAFASQTMHRVTTFCERNGPMCARSGEYWALFKQKLEFGARLAIDMAMSGKADVPEATGSIAPPSPVRAERGRGAADPAADARAKPSKGGA